jgi:acetylornithine/succinyldiaminopimelate/putrescine aminotransferase
MLGFGLNASFMDIAEGESAALSVVSKLLEKGMLTVAAGADTLRWLPPLNVSEEEVELALRLMKEVLDASVTSAEDED